MATATSCQSLFLFSWIVERNYLQRPSHSCASAYKLPGPPMVPILPLELEREIFEITALNFPCQAPVVVLVAKRVRQWIEPLIYKTLVVRASGYSYPALYEHSENGRTCKPNFSRMTSYARHVLLEEIDLVTTLEILENCNNVVDLTLWGPYEEGIEALKRIISALPLERLSTNIFKLQGINTDSFNWGVTPRGLSTFELDPEPLMNLTCLDITYIPTESRFWNRWKKLASLPRLTHLSLPYSSLVLVPDILKECQSLQLLVLIYSADAPDVEWFTPIRLIFEILSDVRVVRINDMGSMENWIEDWISGANGKTDFWKAAEMTKAARLAKREERVDILVQLRNYSTHFFVFAQSIY